mmetsp:Transcript_43034/g.77801  ORF Transcript_43034/g.77801 Transcript_43034/m.77801 type:complete len:235 (-) Transcript_43034:575-1279(-)
MAVEPREEMRLAGESFDALLSMRKQTPLASAALPWMKKPAGGPGTDRSPQVQHWVRQTTAEAYFLDQLRQSWCAASAEYLGSYGACPLRSLDQMEAASRPQAATSLGLRAATRSRNERRREPEPCRCGQAVGANHRPAAPRVNQEPRERPSERIAPRPANQPLAVPRRMQTHVPRRPTAQPQRSQPRLLAESLALEAAKPSRRDHNARPDPGRQLEGRQEAQLQASDLAVALAA